VAVEVLPEHALASVHVVGLVIFALQSAGAALTRLLQSVAPPAPRIFGRMSSAT